MIDIDERELLPWNMKFEQQIVVELSFKFLALLHQKVHTLKIIVYCIHAHKRSEHFQPDHDESGYERYSES